MKQNLCTLCPRNCHADREHGMHGVCGMTNDIAVARAALHMWEEPCISGKSGSGTVFFMGCPLQCIYCQNYRIAHGSIGQPEGSAKKKIKTIHPEELAEIFLELQRQNAANINLVTPTHYTLQIITALKIAKSKGLSVPVVYNCGGYEKAETLRMLKGLVDIYLTDFKYMDADLAERLSHAKDYPEVAKCALEEMVGQCPETVFDGSKMMRRGVIVRHLLLPNHVENAKAVVKYVHETYGDQVYLSLMNQYTPMKQAAEYPELNRRVTKREYNKLLDYALSIGVEQGFIQEGETAKESFIPEFDFCTDNSAIKD